MSARLRDDSGFTLAELLVAMTVAVLVMGAVGFTLVTILRTVGGAQDRVERTGDAGLVSYTFSRDVGSASAVVGGGTAACGDGTLLATITTTNVRRASPTATRVARPVWYCVTAAKQLMRHECATEAACASGTYAETTVLADAVLVGATSKPAIDCQAQDVSATGGFVSLGGCPAQPTARVRRVLLTLTLAPGTNPDRADAPLPIAVFGVKS